jgi:hypothetical protein
MITSQTMEEELLRQARAARLEGGLMQLQHLQHRCEN